MNEAPLSFFQRGNLLSYFSLLSGLLAVFYTRETGNPHLAGAMIALCGLADLFDGRFAKRFQRSESQKAFGVQLDSLTDCIVFGLVPVICLNAALSKLTGLESLVWLGAAYFYVLCAISRLGAYNIQRAERSHFIGLPTTISGLLLSVFLLFQTTPIASIVAMLLLGSAMVAPLPISRPGKFGTAMVTTWALVLFVLHGAKALSNL